MFDNTIDPELRSQILTYFISSIMSDSERAKLLELPKNCRIREGAKIITPSLLNLGENVWIGENAVLDASGELEIGDNTQIGLGVLIWTHDSYKSAILGKNTKEEKKGITRKKTKIGSNCFIGGPSVIMPGVTIGDKCVISPMSVVYTDLPDRTIYNPYKNLIELEGKLAKKDERINELENQVLIINKILGLTNE